MNPVVFPIRQLEDNNSPFILSVDEWRRFSDYMKKCNYLPINIDALEEYICTKSDGKFKESWDRLVKEDTPFCIMLFISWGVTNNIKQASLFWGNGEPAEIISLAQNIVTDTDLICIKHHDNFNQILLEAQNGNLSPNTKSKFLYICNDLSNHTLKYHQQAQKMTRDLSQFYTTIGECDYAYEKCTEMIPRIGIRNHLEYSVVYGTFTSLASQLGRVIPSETHILPIIRKIHRIWSAISYDLKELSRDMSEDLDNLPAIIAALELELAFENLSAIRKEVEYFYKNYETSP
ncbi:hypothetical protein COK05_29785 [Bacillus cereus]|uniref:Uncharacterized protein n=1 Tax=Bacillus cereus TaxID=1396 RepID=A0A2B2KZQ8_BACCE|nr:hypothetical protein [Bacillus cereus]PFQ36743.1 hypothetical protein COK05_29785 [Bacillus cereus]PGU01862.1 hypothetical protein COD21_29265 [Bacillus cereus]